MDCTTYTNATAVMRAMDAKTEEFHKRLQKLYPCIDDVSKLPHAWSAEDRAPPLGLTRDDLGCYFRGNGRREEDEKSAAAVRTDNHIPPSCLLYYFEIKFISKGREGFMGIGLSSSQVQLSKLPGWARESYGYHADDGNTFNGDGRGHKFGPEFTTGDVIGCGYNLVESKCFFTKNGIKVGNAFDDMPSNILLYPTVGLKTAGEEIRANFGQDEFVYPIEQELRSLRKNMTLTISNYPISDFKGWQDTLHKLVQSWLIENSYPKTAEAFSRSTELECKENVQQRIQQRYRIQQSVMNGKISEAIQLTNSLCPSLFQLNPNLLFALKCRQFIELIGGAEEDYQATFNYAIQDNSASNGLQKTSINGDRSETTNYVSNNSKCNGLDGLGDKPDNQQSASSNSLHELMEIDQPQLTSNDNKNKSSNHSNHQQSHLKLDANGNNKQSLLEDADMDDNEEKYASLLHFGRELSDQLQHLNKLYGKNESNEKMLQDAIGLIAFTNPKKSSVANLLEPSEREPLSQLLNNTLVKAEMGESHRLPLDEVTNHLRKLVMLNDSQGKWLIDQLY